MSVCSYSCDSGRTCSRSDSSSDFSCTGPLGHTSCTSTSFCSEKGRDSSGRDYSFISMDGTVCSESEFLTATAVMEGDPTGILAVTLTALQALGYVGPEKFKMACAMEYIQHTCLLPNHAHACFATGARELKLSKELMRSYGEDQQKICEAVERTFAVCTRPNQMHTCYKSGDGNPQTPYAKPEDKPKHESILDKLNRAHI
jgi:hypothetical protein